MSAQQPFDFGAAMRAATNETGRQEAAEQVFKGTVRDSALAERVYREALAKRILEYRAEGQAATVAADLARGNSHVAELRFKRDLAEGMKEAAQQALWRKAADRRDLGRFIEWSMRADIAVHAYGQQEAEPENVRPIGAVA